MQDPFETPRSDPRPDEPEAGQPLGDEIIATPDQEAALRDAGEALAGNAPLHEIATAFRMNAEALNTLKQMQGDLADSVKRGDRSQLVVQSTKALNETFRNLSAVQRELLSRLDESRGGAPARSSPLVPMLLLGLLVVLLGGIYVVLEAVNEQGAKQGDRPPANHAKEVMESWKQGRAEGAEHADAEIQRLGKRLEDEKARGRRLEKQLDERGDELGTSERARRTAELERDSFASQIQKARAEVLAKKTLEDEVLSLNAQADSKERILKDLQTDLDLQRRQNKFLRQRLADYGMGFSEDDPPWRPGVAAGAEDPDAPGKIVKLPPTKEEERQRIELLIAGRKKMGMDTKALEAELAKVEGRAPTPAGANAPVSGSASDTGAPATEPTPEPDKPKIAWARSAVPPPAPVSDDEMRKAMNRMGPAPKMPIAPGAAQPTTQPQARRQPATTQPAPQQPVPNAAAPQRPAPPSTTPRAGAYGGDSPNTLPPPVLRKRGSLQRERGDVSRVQSHLNELLDTTSGREGWQLSRVNGVATDRLGDVILMRYDETGRPIERFEARDMRINLDRTRKTVTFDLRDGVRVSGNQSLRLPPSGTRIVVAAGSDVNRWSSSSLTLINRR